MKAYFAKYLTVPGEIRIGERALLGKHTITGIIDKQYLGEIKKNKKLKDYTPIRLFICSRKITVGDIVRINGQENEYVFTDVEIDEGLPVWNFHSKNGDYKYQFPGYTEIAFKVISEVPQNHTNVNPGDEFNEDEIKNIIG